VKIGLWVEGATDIAFFPELTAKVLDIDSREIVSRNRRGTCIRGVKHGLAAIMKEFQTLNCTHIVVCADNHQSRASERARLVQGVMDIAAPMPCAVGVAIECLEAWLLADFATLCETLKVPPISQPPLVEQISDPKEYLRQHLDVCPNLEDLRIFASKMNIERARRTSESFDRFICALESWRT